MQKYKCNRCYAFKTKENFYVNKTYKRGFANTCKECVSERSRKNYKTDPEKYRAKLYKQKYGITVEEYNDLWEKQGGLCAICGIDHNGARQHFAVDHNHDTGEVRGLLCNSCNYGLGQFKDSPAVMSAALQYLEDRGHYGH